MRRAFAAAGMLVLASASLPVCSVPSAASTTTSRPVIQAAPVDTTEVAELRHLARDTRASRAAARTVPAAVPATPAVAIPPATAPAAPRRRQPTRTAAYPAVRVTVGAGVAGTVVAFALAQVGKPYFFGAAGPYAYDCSGLVDAAYGRAGVSLPHFTGALLGRGRPVGRSQLRPGDLVFPTSGHVAIYLGGNMMVEAPHSGASVRVIAVYSFYAGRTLQ